MKRLIFYIPDQSVLADVTVRDLYHEDDVIGKNGPRFAQERDIDDAVLGRGSNGGETNAT